MERTGTSFDMNPDSFTLENMFAMELHKYSNVIGDIVTSAIKELSIEKASFYLFLSLRLISNRSYSLVYQLNLRYLENILSVFAFVSFKGVKDVVATWENVKFSVLPYLKGTHVRGHVLGAVDEILLNVDSDAMNLQSMAGSRFVGPFLGIIQKWEKKLSLISETIEVGESGHISQYI